MKTKEFDTFINKKTNPYAMGRPRVSNPEVKRNIQISQMAYDFFNNRKNNRNEPFYAVVNRFIGRYREDKIASVAEELDICQKELVAEMDKNNNLSIALAKYKKAHEQATFTLGDIKA